MATKAATFAAKVRSLQESCNRIASGTFPQPSATDVITNLKFFSQALLSVLKDASGMTIEVIRSPEKDYQRTSLFPSLDYTGLYTTLVQLFEILPHLQTGVQSVGQALIHTLSCLVPFLEHEYMDTLPYLAASLMAILPSALHKDLLDLLCYSLLPSTIIDRVGFDNQNFTNISVPAIMMMVFFYTDSPSYYTQLIETLMKLKKDVIKDLFCVIAHGTVKARCPAIELLFQYWPELNPSPLDRKFLSEKHVSWSPLPCEHVNCASSMSKEAVKMVVDHTISIGSGDRPPPLLVCIECADSIHKEGGHKSLQDILLPLEDISYTCVSKSCKASIAQKIAVSTCFSGECVSFNGNRPVRYCALCDQSKHSSGEGINHVVHRTILSPWKMDHETQSYFVEAIVNLLKEAQPLSDKPGKDSISPSQSSNKLAGTLSLPTDESIGNMAVEERQLLSRYGVWLIISLCTPNDDTSDDVLGRLLSMLFQWFHYTACLPDDHAGSALERLKGECIQGWLMKVMKSHFHIFSNCLLPHPADYTKVGGHWDCWPSQTNQIKEGFKRLLCLVPYDIITADVWSYIMPYWMECFRHEVPEEELAELKILLSKVLDPDLSPLGLDPKQMYEFISVRFSNTTSQIQEQALYWIQILTMLEVPVPLKLLLSMFDLGLKSLSHPDRSKVPFANINKVSTNPMTLPGDTNKVKDLRIVSSELSSNNMSTEIGGNQVINTNDDKLNLTCYILMLDILIKQMELQDVNAHKGLENSDAIPVLRLLLNILKCPWCDVHTCNNNVNDYSHINEREEAHSTYCTYCETIAIWYQLALIMMEYFCPVMEATMIDMAYEASQKTAKNYEQAKSKDFAHINGDINIGQNSDLTALINVSTTIEEFATNDIQSSAKTTPSSDTVSGHVRSMFTHSEQQKKSSPDLKNSDPSIESKIDIGKLPIQLQFLHVLLEKLSTENDADVLYHIIYIIKLMALHSEVLNKAARDHLDFLISFQENHLIPTLWSLLQAEFSQISQLCVPLLMHCITLPSGREIFLKAVENDFGDYDWRKRFTAVERITTIAHFLDSAVVKNSPSLQTSLTNAFCYLVHCLDDIESAVAQRALLNLESIKTSSLKLLVWCLESQFDMILVDRPIILQTIFQLYNHLSDRRFLTWDFFLNRFDALFLEAQIHLERIGEINYTRDLKNSNVNSEVYQKKLKRAQEALLHVHLPRSLTLSFSGKVNNSKILLAQVAKLPTLQPFTEPQHPYPRQMSAPMIRRKSSKFTGNAAIPDKFRHLPNNFFTDNQLREITQEESHIMHVVHKIVEIEEQDRDTMHSLIFLLMQFLSRPDHLHPQEEKQMARNQQTVLRHLNILLGYSPTDKSFLVSASNLRTFPVFNAVIASMPKVLDFNFNMGTMLLGTFLPLLLYCPSAHRYSADLTKKPHYSIWSLQPHVRQSWLMSVMIIMYKYSYTNRPLSKQVELLVYIVMNTLEKQFHHCRIPRGFVSPPPPRSRDMSATSIEVEVQDQVEQDASSITEEDVQVLLGESSDESLDEDVDDDDDEIDGEPELSAIVEQPKEDVSSIINREENKKIFLKEIDFIDPVDGESETKVDAECDLLKVQTSALKQNESESFPLRTLKQTDSLKTPASPDEVEQKSPSIDAKNDLPESDNNVEDNNDDDDTDQEPDSELSISESRELEILINASPSRPASIIERMASIDKYRTKKGIKNVLQGFKEDFHFDPSVKPAVPPKPPALLSKFQTATNLPYKPPPERLLPVGLTLQRSGSRKTTETDDNTKRYIDFSKRPFYLPKSCDDLPLPPTERLLPIGPIPVYKSLSTTTEHIITSPDDSISEASVHEPPSQKIIDQEKQDTFRPIISNIDILSEEHQAIKTTVIKDSRKDELPILRPIDHDIQKISKEESIRQPNSQQSKGVNIIELKDQSKCDSLQDKLKFNNSLEKILPQETLNESNIKQKSPLKHPPPLQSMRGSLDQSVSIDMPEDDLVDIKPIQTSIESADEAKAKPVYKAKRVRRLTGQAGTGSGVAANVQRRTRKIDSSSNQQANLQQKRSSTSQSSFVYNEESWYEKCSNCGAILEEFSEDEIGMSIVILGTYIHREPGLSAPLLPQILKLVAKFTRYYPYSWEQESPNIHMPGCSSTIAQQFFRSTLHQLSSNGIFQQIFNSHFPDSEFFKAMAISLTEFMEMNQVTPLIDLFQYLNDKKHLPSKSHLLHILSNAAQYMECISLESISQQAWNSFFPIFETFLRKMALFLTSSTEVIKLSPVIRIILITLKLPIINNHRTLLDVYSKIVSHAIHASPLVYEQLLEMCHNCARIFSKDRDRYLLTRTIVYELIQAIKFKMYLPDENLMMIVQFVLQDLDGTLVPSVVTEHLKTNSDSSIEKYNTNACEIIKQYVNDITEFISDVHTISRIRSTFLGTPVRLNEETLGGHLKAGLSQILALEITKRNGRDHRAVIKYLPWLYSLPSVQQGPKEFLDCVAHIRILSWILLGSLEHSALMQQNSNFSLSQPIPLEANGHIAEHIQVILAGFAELSKTSVLHMSSLFHAFILCQLWTMYCENISAQNPPGSEQYLQCTLTLSDFWAKITPGILQLVCHSKVLAEMVSLHFLSLMEALMECNSNILARLLPMWIPVFRSYEGQLAKHLQVRFNTCINWQPPVLRTSDTNSSNYPSPMLRWLQKLQFKMGQTEIQSSAAIQFYPM